MSTPDTNVNLSSLPYQEKIWREQAEAIGSIASVFQNYRFKGWSGPFGSGVDAFNAAAQFLGTICGQGRTEMNNIANALDDSYKTYQATEQKNTDSAKSIGKH